MNQIFKREYFRAPAEIIIYYCEETPENRQLVSMEWGVVEHHREEEAKHRQDIKSLEDKDLYAPLLPVLRWLDFKIDLILMQMRLQSRHNLFNNYMRTVDISGSGCGVVSNNDLIIGQRLIMALSMPDAPARLLYTIGKVVRTGDSQDDSQPPTAIHFVEIEDSDRERIMRFAQAQQRKQLNPED